MTKINMFKLKLIGPGIVLAAAGVGAGDIITSGVAGASFGLTLLWALLIGGIFKYYLNEGMARYQLATGKTFMEGYTNKFIGFNYYFIVYLIIWSFIVGGALLSGIGIVTNAVFPIFSMEVWGIICGLLVLSFCITGTYKKFELVMKCFALLMFVCFLYSAISVFPSLIPFLKGLFIPIIPSEGGFFDTSFKVLALLGGVGGTVTIMAYSYWIKEKGVTTVEDLPTIKLDLILGYIITVLFGICVLIVAAVILHPTGGIIAGKKGIILLAQSLGEILGPFGFWVFIIGFWAAIFSSLCSFYQAIPYLFCDAIRLTSNKKREVINTKSWTYKGYMLYCVFPPMILLFLKKPVFLIMSYSVLGAFFMPFLALMLLIVNNEKVLGEYKNKVHHNIIIILILVVMTVLSLWKFIK